MTTTLRTLRRSRGLTLTDLALLSGIPARNLGAIELGILSLDGTTRAHLAGILDITPNALSYAVPSVISPSSVIGIQRLAMPLALALTTVTLATSLLSRSEPLTFWSSPPGAQLDASVASPSDTTAPVEQLPTGAPANRAIRVESITAALLKTAASPKSYQEQPIPLPNSVPTESEAPAAEAPPVVSIVPTTTVNSKHGDLARPRGYPLIAPVGQIVVTQGYSEGTHAPAATWGALDFAIDADGDGYAEPGSTRGVPVIATHDGMARIYPGSWPGGNFVRIENRETGWTSAYGHLDTILVSDGQEVRRGDQIGTVGSTGYATGPHLHYEVWRQGVNLDPTPFVEHTRP